MESLWAPKRIKKFFGMVPVLVLDSSPPGGKGEGHQPFGVRVRFELYENNSGEAVKAIFLSYVRASVECRVEDSGVRNRD
jgi:hypothetical protein